MRRFVVTACCIAVVAALSGCSGIGFLNHTTETQTQLTRRNFRVVKACVRGESIGFSLLGFIPIVPASYADAMTNLHSTAPMEGRPTALANVTQDLSQLYLILFSIPRITITADLIEFTE